MADSLQWMTLMLALAYQLRWIVALALFTTLQPASILAQETGTKNKPPKKSSDDKPSDDKPSNIKRGGQPNLTPRQLVARAKSKLVETSRRVSTSKWDQALALVDEANSLLQQALPDCNDSVREAAQPVFEMLAEYHRTLSANGMSPAPLIPFEDMIRTTAKPKTAEVRFSRDIAPWLVSLCGKCHIEQKKGDFSLNTFQDLIQGPAAGAVVLPQNASGSRIVEVIATGDMPRGSGKVSATQLDQLKSWIDAGAKLDSGSPTTELTKWSSKPSDAPTSPEPMTGNETISFSRDIAPVLVQQCTGCHIQAPMPRGNLRMDSLAQLLRGGMSGKAIEPRYPEASLLIKKLRGSSGQRMPSNRPPLEDQVIDKFAKWIEEGAKLDLGTPDDSLQDLADRAWSASASTEEKTQKNREVALAHWKKVLPSVEPNLASDDQFLIVGNIGEKATETLLRDAQAATRTVRQKLKLPADSSLAKGPIVLFAFEQRYDYGEFGKMVEKRSLPSEWNGHWRKSPVMTYLAMHYHTQDAERNQQGLLHWLTAIAIGSHEGVPPWLADGIGRNVLANVHKDSSRVKQWQGQLAVVAKQLQDSKSLLEGKLGEEQSALAGMEVARTLMEKSNRKAFDRFLTQLQRGESFDKAFAASFGPLPDFMKRWVGK